MKPHTITKPIDPPNPIHWLRQAIAALAAKPYFSVIVKPQPLTAADLADFNDTVQQLAQHLLAPYGNIEIRCHSHFCDLAAEFGPKRQDGSTSVEHSWTEKSEPYLSLVFYIEPERTMDATTADLVVHELMHGATELRSGLLDNLGGTRRGQDDDPEEIYNRAFSASTELLQTIPAVLILRRLGRPDQLAGHSSLFDRYLAQPTPVRQAFLKNMYRFVREQL